jgi:hypothetical protein
MLSLPVPRFLHDNSTIPATLVGLVAHVLVSLITPPSKCGFEEVAEKLSRERESIEGTSHEPTSAPDTPDGNINQPELERH